jgi:acyl carrier protein
MTTEEKVNSMIAHRLGVDPAEITRESKFTDDLGADSLDTAELIMDFEKEFSLSIRDEDAETVITVGDAIDLVDKYLAK